MDKITDSVKTIITHGILYDHSWGLTVEAFCLAKAECTQQAMGSERQTVFKRTTTKANVLFPNTG